MKNAEQKKGPATIWSARIFLPTVFNVVPGKNLSRVLYQKWVIGPNTKPMDNIRPVN